MMAQEQISKIILVTRMQFLLNIKPSSAKTAQTQAKQAEQLKIQSKGSIKTLISNILEGTIGETRRNDPQLSHTKNTLLIVLLLVSAYGVYQLIGDFLDVLLIAYIAGIAYNQSKLMFVNFITEEHAEPQMEPFPKRVIKACVWIIFGFIFPRIRYLLANPHKIRSFPTLGEYVGSIKKSDRYIVLVCEILIALRILYLLFGKIINKVARKLRPKNVQCVRIFFAILTIIIVVGLVILIPSVLFKQVSNLGMIIQQKVQQKLGCEVITFPDRDNDTLPLCSQKITSQNNFIQQTMSQFQQQNQTLEECLMFAQKINEQYLQSYIEQYEYLRKNIYRYEEILCTWYSFLEKAITYSGLNINKESLNTVFDTGTNLFKVLFGNLALILSFISNSIFNITTFITTFLLTIQYHKESSAIKQVFSLQKQELITSITSLIQATLFIVLQHFFLSFLLLQLFQITPINLIISTLLASMAMFPFFRPWIGVLLVTLIRIMVVEEYYVNVCFVAIYYLCSQKIYSIHYRKMELHQIVTNMSVLFGIYRFGIVGVLYGPLIIITYQCVERELFKRSS